jgi:2-methylisocitrate lyase-like PEP mutase family enzyme
MATNPPSRTATDRFRELLGRPGLVLSLGAHDVLSALLMEQAGLEMIFLGGFGVSASMLGLPDLNFLTMTEMADAVRRTTARVSIPVVADGDTGHGDLHLRRTVEMFEAAGAAGILIEDQVMPKRCGHFAGKRVVPQAEMIERIREAVRARSDPRFTLFARTDAREEHGLDEAIERVNRCCDAGADVAFIEAPRTRAELEAIPRRVPHPLLANMLTGGVTPLVPAAELEQLGYKFAVCPIESLLVCVRAVQQLCARWQATGRAEEAAPGNRLAELEAVARGGFLRRE